MSSFPRASTRFLLLLFAMALFAVALGCGTSIPSISINDISVAEGDSGTTSFTFTVTLSATPDVGRDAKVSWWTSNITATTASGDYTYASGQLTFTNGDISKTITVNVNGDVNYEANETFYVNLCNAIEATISNAQGIGTILNDEVLPTVSINDVSASEGNSGTTSFSFTVTLNKQPYPGYPSSVNWATANGTAKTTDSDYTAANGTLSFTNGGSLTQTVTVNITGDTYYEQDETFYVNLSSPTNVTISDSQGNGTVQNDDTAPTIAIGDKSADEGNSGTTNFDFSVTLSGNSPAPGNPVTMSYATNDNTATTADSDYTHTSGTATISYGSTSTTVTVSVNGDTKYESDETFTVTLSSPVLAAFGDNTGIGTIANDDPLPAIMVDPTSPTSGPGTSWATAYHTVQAAMTAASSGDEIWVAADAYTAIGTATVLTMKAGVDIYGGFVGYNGGSGTPETQRSQRDWATNVTTLDGQTTAYRVVVGADSAAIDGFTITRGKANGSGNNNYGGGMYNNYSSPTVANCTFSSNSADYSGGGMYNAYSSPTVANCTFTNNTAAARGGGMFNYYSSPTMVNCTFSSNNASTYGGGMYNGSSSPTVTNSILWGNTAGTGGAQVYDNSSTPTITYSCVQGGYTGTGNISTNPNFVTGSLRLSSSSPCIDAGKNSAISLTTDLDGNTRKVDDPNTTDTGSGTAPIVDMGAYEHPVDPTVSINDVSASEGNSGTVSFSFTVTLSQQPYPGYPATVNWATADNTATTADNDYTSASGTLTFTNGGSLTQTVTVNVTGDVFYDTDETFYVNLTNPANATISDGQGVGTIQNDDGMLLLVDPTSPGSGGNGLRWATAYHTVQAAMTAASSGAEIWVAAATYNNGGGYSKATVLTMKSGVDIYGGFSGYGSGSGSQETACSQRDWATNVTTLDGLNYAYHVVKGASNAVIDGFTIKDGNANSATPSDRGGGMYNDSASPTVANCTFSSNYALTYGGGMLNVSSSPTVTNCTFSSNSANYGGGIANWSHSSPTVTNCTFSGNSATKHGGGMSNTFSSPTVTNCTFSSNSATTSGGGIYNDYSSPTVTNCILWGNTAPSGAQIYKSNGTPTVTYSCVQGGYSGTGNISTNPNFASSTNLRLSSTSPCIDAGNNSAISLTTDLDGNPRKVDDSNTTDTGSGTAPIVDMGAYEYQPPPAGSPPTN